jgi:restriction system protein
VIAVLGIVYLLLVIGTLTVLPGVVRRHNPVDDDDDRSSTGSMARPVLSTVARIQRDMNRGQAARVRAHDSAVRQAERAHAAAVRESERARRAYERAQIADEKERARLYAESRAADVAADNEALEQRIAELSTVLAAGLEVDSYVDLATLKRPAVMPTWQHGHLERVEPAPDPSRFTVEAPSGMGKLFGGKAHQARVEAANAAYAQARAEHAQRESSRTAALAQAQSGFETARSTALAEQRRQHNEIDAFTADLDAGEQEAILTVFELALQGSALPDGFPTEHRLAYVRPSRQLVVEFELPPVDVVPTIKMYRYVKSTDEVTSTARPATQIRALYSSMLAQLTLRVMAEMFGADRGRFVDSIVVNAMLHALDPRTGQPVHPCLITVRTTRELFAGLDLANVDAAACLRHLSASVSRSPAELEPVRPVLEFSMVDERFVDQEDVLSGLDSRPNLMELTPTEFESLISNLFSKMGLDTRQTRPSRDGGVDCVAFDQRAILGGKVVIQAKRYKNTVGVSAVRDLYGTVMNEGASKGILVTTSGYGRASVEFANGKPLELLDGANLLSLLADHAGIQAKIVAPESWQDPREDSPDTGAWNTPARAATAAAPAPSPAASVARTPVAPLVVAGNECTPTDGRPRCTNAACTHHGEPIDGRQCPHCFHYIRS